MTTTEKQTRDAVFDSLRGTRDALSVKRVFGDSYELDGVMIIPVARVAGGGGGGGGEGSDDDENSGSGFGTGFGIGAIPIGVYQVRDGGVEWKPALDLNRLIKGAEVLLGLGAVCLTLVALKRR